MLADPSAAMGLLWLARSLHFLVAATDQLRQNGEAEREADSAAAAAGGATTFGGGDMFEDPMAGALRLAYAESLEPYHGWMLRKTLQLASTDGISFARRYSTYARKKQRRASLPGSPRPPRPPRNSPWPSRWRARRR